MLHSYHAAGLPGETDATSPDHLGHGTGAAGLGIAAEADAWTDGLPTQAAPDAAPAAKLFWQIILLRWLAPCMVAMQQAQAPFSRPRRVNLSLAADHYAGAARPPEGPKDGQLFPIWQ